ncbi:MAG: CinA family protein, partial [Sphingorhabdus sp.]
MQSTLPKSVFNLAKQVVEANRAAGRTVVTAESCTGGLVAAALTEIPGSSAVLQSGFVTYSNEAKIKTLKVGEELIETFGAVSIAVAWAMAQGALKRSSADIAVAISGV